MGDILAKIARARSLQPSFHPGRQFNRDAAAGDGGNIGHRRFRVAKEDGGTF